MTSTTVLQLTHYTSIKGIALSSQFSNPDGGETPGLALSVCPHNPAPQSWGQVITRPAWRLLQCPSQHYNPKWKGAGAETRRGLRSTSQTDIQVRTLTNDHPVWAPERRDKVPLTSGLTLPKFVPLQEQLLSYLFQHWGPSHSSLGISVGSHYLYSIP